MHAYPTKQIVFTTAPEKLGEVTQAFAKEEVNVVGFAWQPTGASATARVLSTDPPKAEKVVQGLGLKPLTRDVLCVAADNKPGSLALLTEKLTKAGLKVEALYGHAAGVPEGELVLEVNDVAKAEQVLKA